MERKIKREKNRSAFAVMAGLIGMVYPLLGIMAVAIIMGCIGNLMATFITILGGYAIGGVAGAFPMENRNKIFFLLAVCAVLRGVLRYAEQASNHYIAFKLLAAIRHKVFSSLRKLAPAKLDGSDKGNLISIITSDIELLEVFYAHTISPIAIAFLTSLIMSLYIGHFDKRLGILAAVFYLIVGAFIPIYNGHVGQKYGRTYRESFGQLNTVVLDNLYGLDEILQYQAQFVRKRKTDEQTEHLVEANRTLKRQETLQRAVTDGVILFAGVIMLSVSGYLARKGLLSPAEAMICTIAMMSSFGPTAALSALSNNLNQTLASGNRVLDLLSELPLVKEVENELSPDQGDIIANNISFTYFDEEKRNTRHVLQDFSMHIQKNQITGILGESGCGKSTFLKLLMRFYETNGGEIMYGHQNVNSIDTKKLRSHISYVTQDTFLFQDSIENNIKVAKQDATREEVIAAAKKASIHDFIESLPEGYETKISELGESLSGGEKQRIGIARAFLHQAEVILLDEPTSNVDSLNEGIILKSLNEAKQNQTILLVSHRKSTMGIADSIFQMQKAD